MMEVSDMVLTNRSQPALFPRRQLVVPPPDTDVAFVHAPGRSCRDIVAGLDTTPAARDAHRAVRHHAVRILNELGRSAAARPGVPGV